MKNVVLFDFDSTLAKTQSIREIRESLDYDALTSDAMQRVQPYRRVPELLKTLKDKGVLVGIVTNAGRGYIDRVLSHLEMTKDFDVVISYTDVKRAGKQGKPAPDGILLALASLGVKPGPNVLFVGDEYIDIVAAYNANVVPVIPSWASRATVSTAPAVILSSTNVMEYFEHPTDFQLFGERAAQHASVGFPRKAAFFLPLDLSGNIVTVAEQLRILCLGRYFNQKSVVTATLHESHALSKHIVLKESSPKFELQGYWEDVVLHVLRTGPEYVFQNTHPFDLISVVPGKTGGHPRLENFLQRVQQRAGNEFSEATFDGSLLTYVSDALKQKTLSGDQRAIEAVRALHLSENAGTRIAGRNVLVIDDVITTGSTLARAINLMEQAGAASVTGLAFAKTVSVQQDDKICPTCSRTMRLRKNANAGHHFWGCSGYGAEENPCAYTEDMQKKLCPACNRLMARRKNKKDGTWFWGCTGYNQTPSCNNTENIE